MQFDLFSNDYEPRQGVIAEPLGGSSSFEFRGKFLVDLSRAIWNDQAVRTRLIDRKNGRLIAQVYPKIMKLKSIFLLLVAMWIPVLSAADDDAKPLPKFEKLLPSEKFFNKEALPVGHTFGFATNKNIEEIKKLLLKALGDGWKFKVASADYLELINKNSEVKMEAVGNLSHKDFGKYSIGVTMVPIPKNQKEEFMDYKRILSIVTVDLEIAAKLNSRSKKQTEQKKEDAERSSPASKSEADK